MAEQSEVKVSAERMAQLEAIEQKVQAKQEKMRLHHKRRNAALILYRDKALAAGITVSEEEIDDYLTGR